MTSRSATMLSAIALLAACGGPASQDSVSQDPAPLDGNTGATAPGETSSVPPSAPDAETMDPNPADRASGGAAGPATITPEFAALPAPYNTANYAAGRRTWALCSSCHTLEAGAGHRVGPNLHGMFDREVGSLESFGYSIVLEEADFQWTPEQLDAWLANPRTFLEGNRMTFAGVRKPEDRQAVIAYMMTETGYTPGTADAE